MQRCIVYFIWKLLYMFRMVPYPYSGTQTTVPTASDIFYTVTTICRYRGNVGTDLSVLWVAIVRNANNRIYSIWYFSYRYCSLPLSWKSWNWFECAVGGVRHPQHTQTGSNIYVSVRCNVYTVA